MMNYIWAAMMLLAFAAAAWQGNMQALSNAIMAGASDAVSLCIKLLGALCLWGGLMEIAKASGLTKTISRILSPLLRLLFPRYQKDSPAMSAISMNITANLLGLGNAATPLGLTAMRCLQEENPRPGVATDEMVNFVVLNTAALHLIPTTVALLRQEYGAAVPMDIMPAAWLTSAAALCVGLTMAWLLKGRRKNGPGQVRERTHAKKGGGG